MTVRYEAEILALKTPNPYLAICRIDSNDVSFLRPVVFERHPLGAYAPPERFLSEFNDGEIDAFLQAVVDLATWRGITPSKSDSVAPATPEKTEVPPAAALAAAQASHLADLRLVVHHMMGGTL